MLVPLAEADEVSDQHPFAQLYLAGLQLYDGMATSHRRGPHEA
jgi:hypothetical protein